jgi:hypothetical protein
MDERDVVPLFPLARPHFVVKPEVVNNTAVRNQDPNHHGIVGYLSDAAVAKQIHAGLQAPN